MGVGGLQGRVPWVDALCQDVEARLPLRGVGEWAPFGDPVSGHAPSGQGEAPSPLLEPERVPELCPHWDACSLVTRQSGGGQ